jgi:hypothetical protein
LGHARNGGLAQDGIRQNPSRFPTIRISGYVKNQAQYRKELSVQKKPVRANKHILFPDLKPYVNDVSADGDARGRKGLMPLILGGGLMVEKLHKWAVQHHLNMGISETE